MSEEKNDLEYLPEIIKPEIENSTHKNVGEIISNNQIQLVVSQVVSSSFVKNVYKVKYVDDLEDDFFLAEVKQEFSEILNRQFEVLKKLKLPLFPEVITKWEDDKHSYLLYKHKEGFTLSKKLSVGDIKEDELLEILRQLCYGLRILHLQGWVHLGINPDSIICTQPIQLINWDFVSRIGEKLQRIPYYPGFSAPEIVLRPADPKMDIFSIGALAYLFITGKPLEEGKEYQGLDAVKEPGWVQLLSGTIVPFENRFPNTACLNQQIERLKKERKHIIEFEVVSNTSIGSEPRRLTNEDSYGYLIFHSSFESSSHKFGIFAIADGMGGHQAGEIASRAAIETCLREFSNIIFKFDALPTSETINLVGKKIVSAANAAIYNLRYSDAGTTLTVAVIVDKELWIFHIGDTRCYLIRTDEIKLLTRDHSIAYRDVERGILNIKELRKHPNSSILYRSLGTRRNLSYDDIETLKTKFNHEPIELQNNDVILLCTDGVWSEIEDEEIKEIIIESESLDKSLHKLINKAITNGSDNATAILIKIVENKKER